MKEGNPFVDIVVVNYNGKKHLKGCLDSLRLLNYPKRKVRVVMVDNGSRDASLEFVQSRYPEVRVMKNDRNNYCRAINLAITQTKGEYVAVLNNDTKVTKAWLRFLVDTLNSGPRIAAAGGKLLFPSGKINSVSHAETADHYWVDSGFQEDDLGQYDKSGPVDSLCGGAVLYRRQALNEVGLFDEDFNMYVEDVDISLRLKKRKWKLWYCHKAVIYHHFHGTASSELVDFYVERNRLLLLAKHFPEKLGEALQGKGYFRDLNDTSNSHDLYAVLPQVVQKLLSSHQGELGKTLPAFFAGLKKIVRDHQAKELGLAKDEAQKLLVELTQRSQAQAQKLLDELAQRGKELAQKENLLAQREKMLNEKNTQLWKYTEYMQEVSSKLYDKDLDCLSKDNQLIRVAEQTQKLSDELKKRREEIAGQDTQLAQKETELSQKGALITQVNAQAQELINELKKRREEIAGRDTQLAQKETELSQKGTLITQVNAQVKQILEELKKRSGEVAARDMLLKQQERVIAIRDTFVAQLEEQLQQLQGALQYKEEELAARARMVIEKDNALADKESSIRNLQQLLAASEEKTRAFYASETFRFVIRPLWRLANFLKALKSFLFRKIKFPLGFSLKRRFFSDSSTALSLSTFSTVSNTARMNSPHLYIARIANSTDDILSGKIVVSIWPQSHKLSSRPARIVFAKNLSFKPKMVTTITAEYNWQDKAGFIMEGECLSPDEYGADGMVLRAGTCYAIEAVLYDSCGWKVEAMRLYQELKDAHS